MNGPAVTDAVAEPVAVRQLDSPWMTVHEAAIYSRRAKSYVLKAIREYRRTKGRSGLKAAQEKPLAAYRVHVDDVTRWMHGEPPTRGTRRFAST